MSGRKVRIGIVGVGAAGAYTTITPRISIPHASPMDHFTECITHGKTPLVTPEQGVAVTAILDGIRKPSEGGRA